MTDSSLFDHEEETLAGYQRLVDSLELPPEDGCPYAGGVRCVHMGDLASLGRLSRQLLQDYKKVHRQSVRLIKLGDMQQEKIAETNKALARSQEWLELRNRFIRNTFGRYLSDEIVDSILDTSEGLKLGGEDRVVTILMTDLRGFTAMSERLSAEGVVTVINTYLGVMTEIIHKYAGIIDEILGDAILVIFGAPITRENDPQRAVACALEMQNAMVEVNRLLVQKGFLIELAMGIGINTGSVVVGNIGSQTRSKYAVVGKNVNLAARIESYSIGGQVLISESTLKSCGHILDILDQMEVTPKGIQGSINVYSVGGIGAEYAIQKLAAQNQAMVSPPMDLLALFVVLQEKQVGKELFEGAIVGVSSSTIAIRMTAQVACFADLKITILHNSQEITSELFGKVTKVSCEGQNTLIQVAITSMPDGVAGLFNRGFSKV